MDEESAELTITFGSSSKTSDFIVDVLAAQWDALDAQEKAATNLIQIKMDNGPEGSGRRTQFLHRMVQLADDMNKPIQLLYYPPYHSKYHPIEKLRPPATALRAIIHFDVQQTRGGLLVFIQGGPVGCERVHDEVTRFVGAAKGNVQLPALFIYDPARNVLLVQTQIVITRLVIPSGQAAP